MTLVEKAIELRALIEKAMTETASLTEAEAVAATCLYPKWSGNGVAYVKGQRVQDDGVLYTVLQNHTSQAGWKPAAALLASHSVKVEGSVISVRAVQFWNA